MRTVQYVSVGESLNVELASVPSKPLLFWGVSRSSHKVTQKPPVIMEPTQVFRI